MTRFSDRSDVEREPNALAEALEKAEVTHDLTPTNPVAVGLGPDREPVAAALAAIDPTAYAPHPLGSPIAREALAERGLVTSAGHTMITASTSEAYAYLFRLLSDPGSEVLVPAPSYPLLEHLAHAADVQLTPYALRWDGDWHVSSAELFEAIGERTAAIVMVSPNNPTGQYLDDETEEAIGALGVPLVLDEVFRAYPLEGEVPRRITPEVLTFRLDGLSKRAALPGMKLGWTSVEGPTDEVHEALSRLEVIADAFLSPAYPAQLALGALLDVSEPTRARIRERCLKNLATLRSACEGTAFSVPSIEGGWSACVRAPATDTDEAHALTLLEHGVRVHPGYFYDFPDDEAWLVLSLLTPEDTFASGVELLVSALG